MENRKFENHKRKINESIIKLRIITFLFLIICVVAMVVFIILSKFIFATITLLAAIVTIGDIGYKYYLMQKNKEEK